MHVYSINYPLFRLPDSHPAHRFLRAFITCREQCVGREFVLPGDDHASVDQEWYSLADDRTWTFSAFAYTLLSFDVELDGWLTNAPHMTTSEAGVLDRLPYLRTLLGECEAAAVDNRNTEILAIIEQVRNLLDLWENCITTRLDGKDEDPDPGDPADPGSRLES